MTQRRAVSRRCNTLENRAQSESTECICTDGHGCARARVCTSAHLHKCARVTFLHLHAYCARGYERVCTGGTFVHLCQNVHVHIFQILSANSLIVMA